MRCSTPRIASAVRGFIINKFRGDRAAVRATACDIDRSAYGWAVARRRAVAARGASAAGGRRGAAGACAAATHRRRAYASPFPIFRTSPTSTTSIPCAPSPRWSSNSSHRGGRCPSMRISSSFPAAKRRSQISSSSAAQGWHIDLLAHVRRGGRVLGICAGYQMLGRSVEDPQRIEGPQTSSAGLDLLEVHSTMTADKTLRPVSGVEVTTGQPSLATKCISARPADPALRDP